jgi:hypothetical protein
MHPSRFNLVEPVLTLSDTELVFRSLQKRFDFTDDDLATNRAGRLSPMQLERMSKTNRAPILTGLALMIGFGWCHFSGTAYRSAGTILFCLSGIGVAAMLPYFALLIDLSRGRVDAAEGIADFYVRQYVRGGNTKHVSIGGVEFSGDELMGAFPMRHRYRVYYTPLRKRIVAVDVIY